LAAREPGADHPSPRRASHRQYINSLNTRGLQGRGAFLYRRARSQHIVYQQHARGESANPPDGKDTTQVPQTLPPTQPRLPGRPPPLSQQTAKNEALAGGEGGGEKIPSRASAQQTLDRMPGYTANNRRLFN